MILAYFYVLVKIVCLSKRIFSKPDFARIDLETSQEALKSLTALPIEQGQKCKVVFSVNRSFASIAQGLKINGYAAASQALKIL